jgi:hypothetical protein
MNLYPIQTIFGSKCGGLKWMIYELNTDGIDIYTHEKLKSNINYNVALVSHNECDYAWYNIYSCSHKLIVDEYQIYYLPTKEVPILDLLVACKLYKKDFADMTLQEWLDKVL